jgi:hypothetical protein
VWRSAVGITGRSVSLLVLSAISLIDVNQLTEEITNYGKNASQDWNGTQPAEMSGYKSNGFTKQRIGHENHFLSSRSGGDRNRRRHPGLDTENC